jgi:hypothetical protein
MLFLGFVLALFGALSFGLTLVQQLTHQLPVAGRPD